MPRQESGAFGVGMARIRVEAIDHVELFPPDQRVDAPDAGDG